MRLGDFVSCQIFNSEQKNELTTDRVATNVLLNFHLQLGEAFIKDLFHAFGR